MEEEEGKEKEEEEEEEADEEEEEEEDEDEGKTDDENEETDDDDYEYEDESSEVGISLFGLPVCSFIVFNTETRLFQIYFCKTRTIPYIQCIPHLAPKNFLCLFRGKNY